MIEKLTDENFTLYAAKHYDNSCKYNMDEFYDDIKRFQYIKRLLLKYKDNGELRERLVLNHIIILYNLFGSNTTEMLFLRLEGLHEYLKPFVVLLGYMDERIEYNNKVIYSSDIPLEETIVKKLREI